MDQSGLVFLAGNKPLNHCITCTCKRQQLAGMNVSHVICLVLVKLLNWLNCAAQGIPVKNRVLKNNNIKIKEKKCSHQTGQLDLSLLSFAAIIKLIVSLLLVINDQREHSSTHNDFLCLQN